MPVPNYLKCVQLEYWGAIILMLTVDLLPVQNFTNILCARAMLLEWRIFVLMDLFKVY